MEDILIPLGLFAMVVAIVALNVAGAASRRKAVMETIREAVRAGQQLTPETVKALGAEQKSKGNGDLKGGAILIAVALSLVFLGFTIGQVEGGDTAREAMLIMPAVASFPGLIGVVLVLFGLFGRRSDAERD